MPSFSPFFLIVGVIYLAEAQNSGDDASNIRHCLLMQDPGPCRASMPRYYFDRETGACQLFHWGGCDGNKNNFDTNDACRAQCQDVVNKCLLLPYQGPCKSMEQHFFYDSTTNRCRPFRYGGCLSNGNNFPTKKQCENKCKVNF